MPTKYEEPKVSGDDERQTITHPSYAQIQASRVTTGGISLYGSEFNHQHYVVIRIARSEVDRSLSNDWPHTREELIEVALSPSQWAEFVSSMNFGSGVQCTIQRVGGERVPQIPMPERKFDQFKKEASDADKETLNRIDALIEKVNDAKLGKNAKDEIVNELKIIRGRTSNSLVYVMEQFGEHMEKTVNKARMEISAYAQTILARTGLNKLLGEGKSSKVLGYEDREDQ